MSTPSGDRNILYVEDDCDNIGLMERVVRLRSGIDLLVATNGATGVEAATTHAARIRLVLLDHRLPDMTGGDVARALRASAATADLPVAMISGDNGNDQEAAMLEAGVQHFLPKPFDLDELLGLIDRYCS